MRPRVRWSNTLGYFSRIEGRGPKSSCLPLIQAFHVHRLWPRLPDDGHRNDLLIEEDRWGEKKNRDRQKRKLGEKNDGGKRGSHNDHRSPRRKAEGGREREDPRPVGASRKRSRSTAAFLTTSHGRLVVVGRRRILLLVVTSRLDVVRGRGLDLDRNGTVVFIVLFRHR